MYTYLNQRYGLKQLIIDWAHAIISAIKQYSRQCADVHLFGKLLRNEVDEDFRYVQQALKETVLGLLKQGIRERHPLKGEAQVKKLMEELVQGVVAVEESVWGKIVERMYEREDSEALKVKVREAA